jgi:CheY-like chemotaxis protein
MQKHEGSIEIQSEAGKGTVIILKLPIATKAHAIKPERISLMNVRKLRILVVDDDPNQCELIKEFLLIDGHIIQTAVNGEEALTKYLPNTFDVVITDLNMPKMNGKQLLASIKKVFPQQVVILLTGSSAEEIEIKNTTLEVDLVLNKPLSLSQLRKAIAQILEKL